MKMSDELKQQMVLCSAVLAFFEEENIHVAKYTIGEEMENEFEMLVKRFLLESGVEIGDRLEIEAAANQFRKTVLMARAENYSLKNDAAEEIMSSM